MGELGRWRYPGDEGIACMECGERVILRWNGGELDEATCCGITYRGEHVETVVVATRRILAHQEERDPPV